MANSKEHHDMTDRQRQRDIMPEGVYVVKKDRESFFFKIVFRPGWSWRNGTGDKTRRQNQKTAITSQMALTLNGFEPKNVQIIWFIIVYVYHIILASQEFTLL